MHEVDMEALDNALGNVKAIEKLDKWQLLELELRVIKFWDANYHADSIRNVNDICAFNSRQARKKQILQELGKKTDS